MQSTEMTKAQQIRNLLVEGLSPKQIAEKLGMKPQYVYDIRSKSNLSKRRRRIAVKAKTVVVDRAPDQSKVDQMKKYITHLETELLMRDGAINALRNKLYAASV